MISTDFIYDTYTQALEASTKIQIPHLPNISDYLVLPIKLKSEPHFLSDSDSDENGDGLAPSPRRRRKIDQGDSLPDLEMWDEDIELENVPRLCIERPSPLICVNQDLVCIIGGISRKQEVDHRLKLSNRSMNPDYLRKGDR